MQPLSNKSHNMNCRVAVFDLLTQSLDNAWVMYTKFYTTASEKKIPEVHNIIWKVNTIVVKRHSRQIHSQVCSLVIDEHRQVELQLSWVELQTNTVDARKGETAYLLFILFYVAAMLLHSSRLVFHHLVHTMRSSPLFFLMYIFSIRNKIVSSLNLASSWYFVLHCKGFISHRVTAGSQYNQLHPGNFLLLKHVTSFARSVVWSFVHSKPILLNRHLCRLWWALIRCTQLNELTWTMERYEKMEIDFTWWIALCRFWVLFW